MTVGTGMLCFSDHEVNEWMSTEDKCTKNRIKYKENKK